VFALETPPARLKRDSLERPPERDKGIWSTAATPTCKDRCRARAGIYGCAPQLFHPVGLAMTRAPGRSPSPSAHAQPPPQDRKSSRTPYAALFRSAEALRAENLFLRRLLALYIERGLPPHRVDDQQRLSVDWIPARSRPRAKKNERPFTRPHCTRVWITVGPFPAALASDVHRARAAAQPSLDLAQVDLRLRLLILEGRGATQLVRLEKLVRLTPSVAGG
jgi:hypothetical protein